MDAGLTGEDLLPTADPDEDGVVNLLEFALGGDPLVADESVLPSKALTAGDVLQPSDNLIANGRFMAGMTDSEDASVTPSGFWTARAEDKVSLADPVTWESAGGSLEAGTSVELSGWSTVTNAGEGLLLSGGSVIYGLELSGVGASWTTPDGLVTMTDTGGSFGGGGNTLPMGFTGSSSAGNANAWDQADNASLVLDFNDSEVGLTQVGTRWSGASAVISGFLFDPEVTIEGDNSASATWDAEAGTLTIDQDWEGDTIILYDFARPEASAGQTLVFDFNPPLASTGSNYQFALNRIGYGIVPDADGRVESMAAVAYADDAYVAATVPASELTANQTYNLRFDFGIQGDADWNVLRDAVVAEIREGGQPGAVLDLSGEAEPAALERVGRLDATFSFQYTTPASPQDLEIRFGSSGAGVGGADDQFRFGNVTLFPVPDEQADYVFSFNRRKGSEEGVNLFFDYSNNRQSWTRIPVVAGVHGEATVVIEDHSENPDLERVEVILPSILAALGRSASGELFGRLHAEYIGSEAFVTTLELDAPDVDSFTEWADQFGLTGADREPGADPDDDGIPNVLEFALGGNPLQPDRSVLPAGEVLTDESGAPEAFVFTFRRNSDSVGAVQLRFEYTSGLEDWTAVTIAQGTFGAVEIDISDAGGGQDLVEITVPATEAVDGRLFGRLEASMP